jgi:hypothetical protein
MATSREILNTMRNIETIEIADGEIAWTWKNVHNEDFVKTEYMRGSFIRDLMELIEKHMIGVPSNEDHI